jgi:hypothetical protein
VTGQGQHEGEGSILFVRRSGANRVVTLSNQTDRGLRLDVTRPILLVGDSVNHRAPSDPDAIPHGVQLAVGIGNSMIVPLVVICPIELVPKSVNQSAPSGLVVIVTGELSISREKYETAPAVVIRPI